MSKSWKQSFIYSPSSLERHKCIPIYCDLHKYIVTFINWEILIQLLTLLEYFSINKIFRFYLLQFSFSKNFFYEHSCILYNFVR